MLCFNRTLDIKNSLAEILLTMLLFPLSIWSIRIPEYVYVSLIYILLICALLNYNYGLR